MSGTRAGGLKAKAKNLELYGSDFYHRIGKRGGMNGHTGGFAYNPALARIAGAKGGKISTRKGIKNGEGKRRRMKNLTRYGVAKDLSTSPYIFTEFVNGDRVDIYFSSKLHMNNFIQKRNENYNMIYNYIYKRFKYHIDCRMLADFNLYTKIENRGFYIRINKEVYLCPKDITLNGDLKTKESLHLWQEMSTGN